ncbi:MAG: threonylcarbamoyl-AMP synthase [Planctomycetota bacterium]|nr:MAG: threonylcarbamoyl-AMP synthase [Planctomycetota bacterium]
MVMDHALPETLSIRWPAESPQPPADTEAALARAAALLAAGRLVAIPTETVYGLAGLALDTAAVERIFIAKGRAATNPLILHVDGIAMARSLSSAWPDAAERIAAEFWPGPVTVVVPKAAHVPDAVTAGGPTVAIRCPDQRLTRLLISRLGQPLAAPSANRSLRLSPTTASHVLESLGAKVDLILDAGPCGHGIESTVVDCTLPTPVILRPGPLGAAALAVALGAAPLTATPAASADPSGSCRSPGQAARHYAPLTPLEVTPDGAARVRSLSHSGRRVGWLTTRSQENQTRQIAASPHVVVVPMPDDPIRFAALLYAVLHAVDKRSLDAIVVDEPPATEPWRAIRDRLARACAADTPGD